MPTRKYTGGERAANLAKARSLQREMSAFKDRVRRGDLYFGEAIFEEGRAAKRTKVSELVLAVPGVGPSIARAAFEFAGVREPEARVETLTEEQRYRLAEFIEGANKHDPRPRGEECLAYLRDHPDADVRELMDELGVCRNTAKRWLRAATQENDEK